MDTILPSFCVLRAIRWQVEQEVRKPVSNILFQRVAHSDACSTAANVDAPVVTSL